MRFFHLGDLHFGKSVHNVLMAEQDQPYWTEQFLKAVDDYDPDAVVIAGDVYDRRVPSQEAVELLDHLLTELGERRVPVLMIAGNHDSGARLGFASRLLQEQGVYIAGTVEKTISHVTLQDEFGAVNFWLMPYLFPKAVAAVLEREDIKSYEDAVRGLLAEQDVDFTQRNVLVAHQFVTAGGAQPEHSNSETMVGNVGQVDASAFDGFDYVALGHIHNAQKIGRDTIRYAGCPLYYDFSEVNRWKGLTLVELGEKGTVEMQKVELPLLHTMRRERGTLEEVLERGRTLSHAGEYIQVILTDSVAQPRTMEQLRAVYGDSLMDVEREVIQRENQNQESSPRSGTEYTLEQLFERFYQSQTGELLDQAQLELVRYAAEQQSRHGGEFVLDRRSLPQEETEELVAFFMNLDKEEQA
jgi:exonuclease SbcD